MSVRFHCVINPPVTSGALIPAAACLLVSLALLTRRQRLVRCSPCCGVSVRFPRVINPPAPTTTGLSAGRVQDDQAGHVCGAGPADEPAHVGGDVGRQGARAGHPQAEAAVDGEAAVQPHLPEGRIGGDFLVLVVCVVCPLFAQIRGVFNTLRGGSFCLCALMLKRVRAVQC